MLVQKLLFLASLKITMTGEWVGWMPWNLPHSLQLGHRGDDGNDDNDDDNSDWNCDQNRTTVTWVWTRTTAGWATGARTWPWVKSLTHPLITFNLILPFLKLNDIELNIRRLPWDHHGEQEGSHGEEEGDGEDRFRLWLRLRIRLWIRLWIWIQLRLWIWLWLKITPRNLVFAQLPNFSF